MILIATLPRGSVPDILDWWRTNAPCFPILSWIARDFLAVPASGVGVENLFSTARDVCHYRRNRLAPETIEAIMIQMSTDRFELKKDYECFDDDVENKKEVARYQEDYEAEMPQPQDHCISPVENLGGLEDDDEVDNNGSSGPMQTELHQPASPPQQHSSSSWPRCVVHKPGHFHRLDNGL